MQKITKILLLFTCVIAPYKGIGQIFYQTTSATIRFFSYAPIEDIAAVSNEGVSVWNVENGAISFKVKIRSFRFEKALMQEHFNENYMESEKFSDASFKGKSMGDIDLRSNLDQKVIIKGVLTVHGVGGEHEIPAMIKFSNNGKELVLHSDFKVKCRDHDITIPKLLWQNIGEVIDVSLNVEFKIIPQ